MRTNRCSHCGEVIVSLPFWCQRCGKAHCPNCRLPESHSCQGPRIIKEPKEPRILYTPYVPPTPIDKGGQHWKLKVAITILIILSIFVGLPYFTTTVDEQPRASVGSQLAPSIEQPKPAPEAQSSAFPPIPVIEKKEDSLEYLRNYALELINKDREEHGLKPVVLGDNKAAQSHADDMLKNKFLSHWGSDGLKPYIRYTKQGGRGIVGENAAFSGFFYDETNVATIKPKEEIRNQQHAMMHDDAESNWGHRDNIIDKNHNKVNVGIAYDSTHLAYVQDFEDDYITWSKLITYSDGTLSMAGTTTIGAIQAVALYYDSIPQPLSKNQLISPPYNDGYKLGDEVGQVIPPPSPGRYYDFRNSKTKYVVASKWFVSNPGSFSIGANIQPLLYRGSGVYTVVIWAKNGNDDIPLTTYSLFIQ